MRLLVLAAAAGGLAAAFVLPLRLEADATGGSRAVMPRSHDRTILSIHPAPGRPESSVGPAAQARKPAPEPVAKPVPAPSAVVPAPPPRAPRLAPPPEPPIVVRRVPPPVPEPERVLAQRPAVRPDDRAVRPFVPE